MKENINSCVKGSAVILVLLLLSSCGAPQETQPSVDTLRSRNEPTAIQPPALSAPKQTLSGLPSIKDVTWDSNKHFINITLDSWPASYSEVNLIVDGVEVPLEDALGSVALRPNSPLEQPPSGFILGTMPWVTGLDKVDFPCCGSLQLSFPNIGQIDKYSYNLVDAGCVTASKKDCTSEVDIDEDKSFNKASTENMVLIPAGAFIMGRENRKGWTPMAAPEMFDDELPPHEVYLKAFYIDKYEVTNAQFKEFVDATGYITEAEKSGASDVMVPIGEAQVPLQGSDIGWKWMSGANWRTPEGPGSSISDRMDYPVVHVTWNDANAYAEWIGKRLPTEAEWEKAARGGTQTNWFWGDALDSSGKYANMYGEHRLDYQYPEGVYDDFEMTAPVGSFQPNEYSLFDMAGNVFEWTADWYQYDYFLTSPGENPQGPDSGIGKVIKGGAWYICECYLRPANRQGTEIKDRNHGLGFRLVLDADS